MKIKIFSLFKLANELKIIAEWALKLKTVSLKSGLMQGIRLIEPNEPCLIDREKVLTS